MLKEILTALLRFITPSMSAEEVAAALNALENQRTEHLDWRHSIVDLMKLLNLDSSLRARNALAQELGYSGDLNGSAEMNMWLHREVISRVATRGITLP